MAAASARSAFAAVVLAGGTGARLGGVDKAALSVDGRPLLARALAAVEEAAEVVVVGAPTETATPVTFTVEDPPGGGPAAGLLAGVAALEAPWEEVVVLAVDMPYVDAATVERLRAALTEDADGAFLVDGDGRRQLAGVLRPARLDPPERLDGLPLHRLLEGLALTAVPATGREAVDIDTWADVRDLRASGPA